MSIYASLMGGGGGGGFEEDPMFVNASRMMSQMDTMMSSMMRDPFGGMLGGGPMMGGMGAMMGPQMRLQPQQFALMGGNNINSLNLMANPMTMMNSMMTNMDQMQGESSSQVYSSSTVMSMTTGPDGRPQMYQSSSTSRGGPGGIRETQHSMSDSRTGVRKMAIGHHIGDRSHIIEKERNRQGDEERQEYVNLDEEEADEFEREFRNSGGMRSNRTNAIDRGRAAAPLALTNGAPGRTNGPADRTSNAAPAPSNHYTAADYTSINRPTAIDASSYDRRAPANRTDRIEYHHPNTNYTPASSSYVRPSSYAPAQSGRSVDGGRGQHNRAYRRSSPYQ